MKFYKGQRVLLVENEGYEYCTTRGKVYIIYSFEAGEPRGFNITDNDGNNYRWMFSHRFKLANSIIKSKLTKLLQQEGEV